ncbi:MAG TPA: DUF3006 domain-containing protein [Firmicutes bacterium]|nr:DUF3006 domain-containing protein [Bacillota bacterium]
MRYIIDRIEGNIAVCEDEQRNMIDINLSVLPNGVKEGSVINYENGKYTADKKSEAERREKIRNLENELFK